MPNPDLALMRLMRTRGHSPAAEAVAKAIAASGEYGAIWAASGLAAAALDRSRRRRWLGAAALAPAAIGLNYAVKLAVRRRRPELDGLPPLGGAPSSLSLPSAHSTASFAVATAMSRIAPRRRSALYAGAVLMGLTRPYLGMHYPSDVVVGAALGTALGKLAPGLHRPASRKAGCARPTLGLRPRWRASEMTGDDERERAGAEQMPVDS